MILSLTLFVTINVASQKNAIQENPFLNYNLNVTFRNGDEVSYRKGNQIAASDDMKTGKSAMFDGMIGKLSLKKLDKKA
ncbi:hypothetical protein ACFLRU_06860 [Bacteroidota bacterium]